MIRSGGEVRLVLDTRGSVSVSGVQAQWPHVHRNKAEREQMTNLFFHASSLSYRRIITTENISASRRCVNMNIEHTFHTSHSSPVSGHRFCDRCVACMTHNFYFYPLIVWRRRKQIYDHFCFARTHSGRWWSLEISSLSHFFFCYQN